MANYVTPLGMREVGPFLKPPPGAAMNEIPKTSFSRLALYEPVFPRFRVLLFFGICALAMICCVNVDAADGSKYAHSDGNARFLHYIHLYDDSNRRISPESTKPYSSMNTCGRCHDYDTISHGWHFNAFSNDSSDGRRGEPWIWTDEKTGTQLPLSYRDWDHSFDPRSIGISQWDMVRKFGGRIPGGGVGHAQDSEDASEPDRQDESNDQREDSEVSSSNADSISAVSRWPLSGSLEIDCLACHGRSGSYDFNARRDQIASENFAWAATAGLRIGTVTGQVSRIKDGSNPEDDSVKEKLPKVAYHESSFRDDGTVFIDLVRSPENNACYQCHSQRTVDESGIMPRWRHDEDVHLRAGMQCTDCHRNGIDHDLVRGFPGEEHPSGMPMTTLSCAGCHLGETFVDELTVNLKNNGLSQHDEHTPTKSNRETDSAQTIHAVSHRSLPGRLGSPKPTHAGLPPLHFEKLSCTACHGGPLPRDEALGVMTSLAHSLGEKGHRSGKELPRIAGPVYAKQPDGRVYPHRAFWPAFWGVVEEGKIAPLHPRSNQ